MNESDGMTALSHAGVMATAAGRTRLRISIDGVVQGMGFRPFVYGLARMHRLGGWAANSVAGVVVEVEGRQDDLQAFLAALHRDAPSHAAIGAIAPRTIAATGAAEFCIRESLACGTRAIQILPDLATCARCLGELFDLTDRRYLHPFISCTGCGPRYSIIADVPYDRANTVMRRFPMCTACHAEYENPADRRFHAELTTCAICGPRLTYWDTSGAVQSVEHDALLETAEMIRNGGIVALKGIGGFQLIADARNEDAVHLLRARKRRGDKPFAVLFPTLTDLRASCRVSAQEEALLTGRERPIVLLERKGGFIARGVAPDIPSVGAMLPYSPLHHLLMHELGFAVIATSGNAANEPIAIDNTEALQRLHGIAGGFLVHDRPILRPVDDSVARVVCGRELLLRRARGYTPTPVKLANAAAGILALGAHLKSTVALTAAGGAILSQHIGDQETVVARAAHTRAIEDVTRLHALRPRVVVRDLHPDYATSHAAQKLDLPVVAVQHHLAHVAACVAEHGTALPVLGVAWDGSGYGLDGTLWGGEFLLVDSTRWRRVAHLRAFRLPGGEAAVREPRRAALGLLHEAFGASACDMIELAAVAAFSNVERKVLQHMLAQGVNAALTSSAGRLFDAFAALSGLRQRASYEGQAAAQLEWAAGDRATGRAYPFEIREPASVPGPMIVDWQPALEAALADVHASADAGAISEALHNGLATVIAAVATRVGVHRVVLTGGCFQNKRLTEAAVAALRAKGMEAIWHRYIPPNDGGIALGQAAWAAWSEHSGERPCA